MQKSIVMASDPGNIGNRMMQFLAANKLQNLLKSQVIENVNLPEWGYEKINIEDKYRKIITKVNSKNLFSSEFINFLKLYCEDQSYKIYMEGYFQDINWFPDVEYCKNFFKNQPSDPEYQDFIDDDHLLINIRAGEITSGAYNFYVQLPIWYYKKIIDETGLIPVFCGQLDNEIYVSLLKKAFPQAYFLTTKGIMSDFFLIRNAKNICISVSTFSWMAAWLSEAKNIFFPLAGFYHPRWHKIYHLLPSNLLPINDFRYRFFNFPFYFNSGLTESLNLFDKIQDQVIEVSHDFAHNLIDYNRNKDYILNDPCNIVFDEDVYIRNNLDCAWGISNKVYNDILSHFVNVGIKKNVDPSEIPGIKPYGIMVSEFTSASQSSICPYSYGKTVIEDASITVNGKFYQNIFNHTLTENDPWMFFDLGKVRNIVHIKILNRISNDRWLKSRCIPFIIMSSEDNIDYVEIYRIDNQEINSDFFDIEVYNVAARYLKLILPGSERIIHIRQIVIYESSGGIEEPLVDALGS